MRPLVILLHAALTTLTIVGEFDCERIVTFKCLWRNFGDIVVWCCKTWMFLVFNHAKLPEIEYESPVYSSALCNNIFIRICIFVSTLFEKQVLKPFEPLVRFVRGSEWLCANAWADNFREAATNNH